MTSTTMPTGTDPLDFLSMIDSAIAVSTAIDPTTDPVTIPSASSSGLSSSSSSSSSSISSTTDLVMFNTENGETGLQFDEEELLCEPIGPCVFTEHDEEEATHGQSPSSPPLPKPEDQMLARSVTSSSSSTSTSSSTQSPMAPSPTPVPVGSPSSSSSSSAVESQNHHPRSVSGDVSGSSRRHHNGMFINIAAIQQRPLLRPMPLPSSPMMSKFLQQMQTTSASVPAVATGSVLAQGGTVTPTSASASTSGGIAGPPAVLSPAELLQKIQQDKEQIIKEQNKLLRQVEQQSQQVQQQQAVTPSSSPQPQVVRPVVVSSSITMTDAQLAPVLTNNTGRQPLRLEGNATVDMKELVTASDDHSSSMDICTTSEKIVTTTKKKKKVDKLVQPRRVSHCSTAKRRRSSMLSTISTMSNETTSTSASSSSFTSSPPKILSVSKHAEQTHNPKFRGYQKDQWSERYDELVVFFQQHGHSSVPHTDTSNKRLARWVKRQRYQHKLRQDGKPSAMTDERIKLLEDLNFVWDAHSNAWDDRLRELDYYKSIHHHCNVPSNYRANSSLASWIKCQRRQYRLFRDGKKSNLTQQRIDQLEQMGFKFNLRPTMQEAMEETGAAVAAAAASTTVAVHTHVTATNVDINVDDVDPIHCLSSNVNDDQDDNISIMDDASAFYGMDGNDDEMTDGVGNDDVILNTAL